MPKPSLIKPSPKLSGGALIIDREIVAENGWGARCG